jgi:hypothetical protein
MTNEITNDQDIIDSREIIERIEELESEHEALKEAVADAKAVYEYHDSEDTKSSPEWTDLVDARRYLTEWLDSEAPAELQALKALAKEAEPESSDWQYGETLIRRSYFVDYVMGMLVDCGYLPKNMPWYIEIDEEATARNIEQDYASVDFEGVEYLIRSC